MTDHAVSPVFRPRPDVVARRVGEAVVLVHLSTNAIFELNETGARIWELLTESMDRAGIVQRLEQEFDVPPGGAGDAFDRLIATLRAEGLLEPS
jgi:hypothetical protein